MPADRERDAEDEHGERGQDDQETGDRDLETIRAELDDLKSQLDDLLDDGEENAFFPPKDREKHANERDER